MEAVLYCNSCCRITRYAGIPLVGCRTCQRCGKAQVLLFESPDASGRYLCTNGVYKFTDFTLRVSKLFPGFPIYRLNGETQPALVARKDAAKRLIDLGVVSTPMEDAVRDTVDSLKEKGFPGQEKSQS